MEHTGYIKQDQILQDLNNGLRRNLEGMKGVHRRDFLSARAKKGKSGELYFGFWWASY